MIEQDAQLVEPLPEGEYRDEHIRGAINIPLAKLNRETTAILSRDQPVIVYCYDTD
jgi:rhodanese-related sulfurtransferase